jgi:hypothetical protein
MKKLTLALVVLGLVLIAGLIIWGYNTASNSTSNEITGKVISTSKISNLTNSNSSVSLCVKKGGICGVSCPKKAWYSGCLYKPANYSCPPMKGVCWIRK